MFSWWIFLSDSGEHQRSIWSHYMTVGNGEGVIQRGGGEGGGAGHMAACTTADVAAYIYIGWKMLPPLCNVGLKIEFTLWRCVCVCVCVCMTYVSGSGRHGSPPLSDKLVGVQANLDDVVEQSQEGRQRERRHEDGGESKLEDCDGDASQHTTTGGHVTMNQNTPRQKQALGQEATWRFTHFQVFVHQSVSVHGLQIPVLVPLWQLGFVFYILPSAPSLLHLPARPPVLQQAGKVEVE